MALSSIPPTGPLSIQVFHLTEVFRFRVRLNSKRKFTVRSSELRIVAELFKSTFRFFDLLTQFPCPLTLDTFESAPENQPHRRRITAPTKVFEGGGRKHILSKVRDD